MSNMSWESLLNSGQFNQTQPGSALSNSTTLSDISAGGNTAGQALTIPASFLQAEMQLRLTANGIISNTSTPNLTLGFYYGGVAGVALATTGAIATATGLSNNIWRMEALLRVESAGTSGSVRIVGSASGLASGLVSMPASSSSGNLVTVDTSTSKPLTVGALWGTASASNSIQCMQFMVESLN